MERLNRQEERWLRLVAAKELAMVDIENLLVRQNYELIVVAVVANIIMKSLFQLRPLQLKHLHFPQVHQHL